MEKVAPSERFRSELDEVLAGVGGEEDPIETVGRLGARPILQQALEDEVSELLGRGRYERRDETVSYRNGHEPKTVKTTSGAMRLERPRIRDAKKLGYESRILGKGVARTHALESLVISGFLRDCPGGMSRPRWRRSSRSRSPRSRPSRGSARTPGSATANGAGGALSSTTSSTASWTRSI
jgi:Transposase, Mutator family